MQDRNRPLLILSCLYCGAQFGSEVPAKYCSFAHKQAAAIKRRRERDRGLRPQPPITPRSSPAEIARAIQATETDLLERIEAGKIPSNPAMDATAEGIRDSLVAKRRQEALLGWAAQPMTHEKSDKPDVIFKTFCALCENEISKGEQYCSNHTTATQQRKAREALLAKQRALPDPEVSSGMFDPVDEAQYDAKRNENPYDAPEPDGETKS